MNVFLLAGQSNMQGFGKIAGYPVLRDERIFSLATGKPAATVEPLHHWHEYPYMPDGIGLGLAMPFALEVLKVLPEITIGFIPSARGGSGLDQWMPGNANFERAVGFYEQAKGNHPEIEFAGIPGFASVGPVTQNWILASGQTWNCPRNGNSVDRTTAGFSGFVKKSNCPPRGPITT